MSGIGQLRGALARIGGDAGSLVESIAGQIIPAAGSATFADFISRLQPASFRGVPFAVVMGESRFGRSIALHEYPFRNEPWPEDLGRATRKFTIQGFIITDSLVYGGGDVIDQREQLVAAAEAEGAGTLIHPTLGRLQVSIPDGGLIVTERLDASNYMEFSLACYEDGTRQFPAASASTDDDVATAADGVDTAAASDFSSDVLSAISYGAFVVDMAVSTATAWVSILNSAAQDATAVFNLAADLAGNFGRYFNGSLLGFAQGFVGPSQPVTLESLILAAAQARADVVAGGEALIIAAQLTEPSGPPVAARGAVAALSRAIVNPADAVRILSYLSDFYPAANVGASVIGQARGTVQDAMGALLRRSALAGLVRATESYQPQSEDDASAVRVAVCDLLEGEAGIAGDKGDDASFQALLSARGAVAARMAGRGAMLPPMRTFTFQESLPALAVAHRLYQDVTRSDELIAEANPPCPAFMPLSFKALSS